MGNTTIIEDAADIIALAIVLDLVEQENDKKYENLIGLSKEQFFFMFLQRISAQIRYTRREKMSETIFKLDHFRESTGVFDSHSPTKGRMNGCIAEFLSNFLPFQPF